MASWTDDVPLLPASDSVLCGHIRAIADPWAERDREFQLRRGAHIQRHGTAVGPRCAPAPCVSAEEMGRVWDATPVVPAGWMLSACPASPSTNQLVFGRHRTCTRTHQSFMNTTRRGTGTAAGSARALTPR